MLKAASDDCGTGQNTVKTETDDAVLEFVDQGGQVLIEEELFEHYAIHSDITATAGAPQKKRAAPKIFNSFPSKNVTYWIVDKKFCKQQERLNIPLDPLCWSEAHVWHWLLWAVTEFSLSGIAMHSFHMNGHQLCQLKHDEFTQYVPNDPGDVFWKHLEMLRKLKLIAVIQKPTPRTIGTTTVSTSGALHSDPVGIMNTDEQMTIKVEKPVEGTCTAESPTRWIVHGNMLQPDGTDNQMDVDTNGDRGNGQDARDKRICHERRHIVERTYKCQTCGKSFTRKSGLVRHERLYTGERPYKCETCGKSFTRKSVLKFHERLHTGERTCKCQTCGKSFLQKAGLVSHARQHTGERPYKCETCGKSFANKSGLVYHERQHTGERPYKCETCGKSFPQKSALVRHERLHTGERPYKCVTCGKSFPSKCGLVYHESQHTGERPYKCKTCGKSFPNKSGLVSHEIMHTGERPYKCKTCGKSFPRKAGLVRHERQHA